MRDGAYVTDPVIRDSNAAYTPGISERRGSATTFLHSGLKNADSQSSTSQTISATRDYDAYGNVISSTGTWSGPFGYAGGFGYQEDGDYGLKLLGHRYYDSSTGRFLTRDPAKDGKNWFAYCSNDPINRSDSSGLSPIAYPLLGLGKRPRLHRSIPNDGSKNDTPISPGSEAYTRIYENGSREFGGNGKPVQDIDTPHPFPGPFHDVYHQHIWKPSPDGSELERGRGEPLPPDQDPGFIGPPAPIPTELVVAAAATITIIAIMVIFAPEIAPIAYPVIQRAIPLLL